MLEEAQAAYARLNERRIKPLHFDLKFHFVDVASDHAQYLTDVLSEREFHIPEHRVEVHHKAFENVADEIIADIKSRQPRAGRSLFLLDQKGFSGVPHFLIRRIFDELANAEVILTFAAETLVNTSVERPQFYSAASSVGLSESDVRDLIDLKHGAGGRALAQRFLRDRLRCATGATYDTPFFIRPRQSRRALWFVHLSRHPVARDVMVQCHWNNFNTFEHYGSGGLDMMGWDSLKDGLLPLFGFSEFDAELLHQQLLDSIPGEMSSLGLTLPVSVGDFRVAVANHTAARFSDLDRALSTLASIGDFDIRDRHGKLRDGKLGRLDTTDFISLPTRRVFPGWSDLMKQM